MKTCGKCQAPSCEMCFPKKIIGKDMAFKKVTDMMLDIHTRKNADYDNSFDISLDEDGLLVSKIRMMDKIRRFSRLINHEGLVRDESIRDTLIDLANYAVMTVMWMDSRLVERKKPDSEE